MSRSWERKVRKNMSTVNKQKKKYGQVAINPGGEKVDRFKGRNIISPVLLILFVGTYNLFVQTNPEIESSGMYWFTVIAYLLLAALFFFRRPYLTVGKDYVQSRRLMGDKRIKASDIERITVLKGYVVVRPKKGMGWTFSRMFNRFKTDDMATRLEAFAATHGITFEQN